jgi:hypothetical protein
LGTDSGISLTARFGLNQQKKKGSWPFDQLPLGRNYRLKVSFLRNESFEIGS